MKIVRERLLKYLPHKDKLKNTKIFGFPITTSINAHDEINVMHYSQMVLSNIIDMENEEMTKNLTEENYPEVFLEYKDLSTPGEIKIKVKYNETLSLERKKLEKQVDELKCGVMIMMRDQELKMSFSDIEDTCILKLETEFPKTVLRDLYFKMMNMTDAQRIEFLKRCLDERKTI